MYNFDEVIDRWHSGAIKTERAVEMYGRTDLMTMWIADMDFPTAPFVREAISKRLEHPILGYSQPEQSWYKAIVNWQKMRYGWNIQPEWLNFSPGIVPGISFAMQCFTKPGDKILVQTPVYPPYLNLINKNGRELIKAPFYIDDEFHMDMKRFAEKAKGCKMFFLCHPHNPGGKVWTKDELQEMSEISAREGVLVISDEIHADLTFTPKKHCPFALVSEEAYNNSITLASPSKAFNMPGLCSSYSIVPNDGLRKTFVEYLTNHELLSGHVFAFRGVEAAYSHGTEWLNECLNYIRENINYLNTELKNIPGITMVTPEASFLVFLDCRGLQLTQEELVNRFINRAGLMLNDGIEFGEEGCGFMRMNVAVPRSMLMKAVEKIKKIID